MSPATASGTTKQILKAIRQLNPSQPIEEAERRFVLALVGESTSEISAMQQFLLGPNPSSQDVSLANSVISTCVLPLDESQQRRISSADLIVATEAVEPQLERFRRKLSVFDVAHPELTVKTILNSYPGSELRTSLARRLPAFREEVSRRIVREVSRENALFVIATALGNVVPSLLQPLLGVAEAAGDTVFLTANQVRMLFVLGAIHGQKVGYIHQWREVSSIIGAAFGWRSLARNLVSKIPFGGGLIPKGAVAYAGTTVLGEGIIFYYTTGRRMTKAEMKKAFARAYTQSVEVVRSMVGRVRSEAPEGDAEGDGSS